MISSFCCCCYDIRETVPLSRLGELDPVAFEIPPQAKECSLAFLRSLDTTQDIGREAAIALNDLCWGKDLVSHIVWHDRVTGRDQVLLYDSSNVQSINEQMARAGYARVSESTVKRGSLAMTGSTRLCLHSIPRASSSVVNEISPLERMVSDLLLKLREAEQEAHKAYRNMWSYGDPGGSDDDDNKARRG